MKFDGARRLLLLLGCVLEDSIDIVARTLVPKIDYLLRVSASSQRRSTAALEGVVCRSAQEGSFREHSMVQTI